MPLIYPYTKKSPLTQKSEEKNISPPFSIIKPISNTVHNPEQ